LDQCGVSLALPPIGCWRLKGDPLCVPKTKAGRINLIGTLVETQHGRSLEYRFLDGSCRAEAVVAYLDTLANLERTGPTLGVLDNASYHQGEKVWAKLEDWASKGLYLWYLPPYSPQLNPIERVWRSVKGELMPRRSYADVEALREALEAALQQVGGVLLDSQVVGSTLSERQEAA